ncbi:hypothetical protein JCM33374_g2915 [Metschnikowia sp. JCM 33374]|nr:hypothetical protein JCM33374_g2915 [Metschnikowia sp. JCM 33374]
MSSIATKPEKFAISSSQIQASRVETNKDGVLVISKENRNESQFPEYLPQWDTSKKYPHPDFFEHVDPGSRADASLPNLLPHKGEQVKNLTPKFGSEVRGVQISELSEAGKDELALLVAQRGVVVFRDQDWAKRGPEFITEYGRYFGKLHIHQTSGAPEGFPELHVTYRKPDEAEVSRYNTKTNYVQWHSDVSYELQPPGTTFFAVLEGPDAGGDTAFADTVEAYRRLSPALQERLEGLHVLHSALLQAQNSLAHGGTPRRSASEHIHPLVRVHPVTKEKALYVNRPFARRIVELKSEESDALLNFLYSHIESAHDLQLRARWEPNTVVVWDNRRSVHTAIIDWDTPVLRHAVRVTPQAERPTDSVEELNKPKPEFGDGTFSAIP